jgi:hypothetical protein
MVGLADAPQSNASAETQHGSADQRRDPKGRQQGQEDARTPLMAEASEPKGEEQKAEAEPAVESQSQIVNDVLSWAAALSHESRGCVEGTYRPPGEIGQLIQSVENTNRCLYVLTGPWGVGKSTALAYIEYAFRYRTIKLTPMPKPKNVCLIRLVPGEPIVSQIAKTVNRSVEDFERRWKLQPSFADALMSAADRTLTAGEAFERMGRSKRVRKAACDAERLIQWLTIRYDVVLLDSPDFARSDSRLLLRILNQLQDLWVKVMEAGLGSEESSRGPNFILTLQKELFDLVPTYFLGRALAVEIKPLAAADLAAAYKAIFVWAAPFTDESLLLIAGLSRGIFRRFLKFITAAVQDMQRRNLHQIDVGDVAAAIKIEMVAREMEIELASIFPRREPREKAIKIIFMLLQRQFGPTPFKPLTQQDLAEALSLTEMDMSRLIDRLEANGIVRRQRGPEGNALELVN